MLRTLLLPSALLLALVASAQVHDHRTCGAHTFTERYLELQGLAPDVLHALPAVASVARGGTYTIPVVVHVVYNNTAENIATSTINALIAELNQDYSATNSDIGSVRSQFTNSVGNVGFQFCLAQIDPNGAATTGITRTQTSDTWFDPDTQTDAMKSAPLGHAPWDTERYLNIWICDITSGAAGNEITVGYAYLPVGGVVGSDIDGLVIDYDYGTQIGARTATHEIGHYFGLMHTFDEDGACVNSDGFTDTPTSNSPTFSCSNTSLMKCGVLTQYENFMDYSNCTVMFTDQQAAYMLNVLSNTRDGLLTNAACSGPVTGLCIPTSAGGTSDGDYINRVAVGTINNNNSGGVGQPAYTDLSGSFSTNLTRGTQYTLTVQGGTFNNDHVAAWIDYDQDETFEAGEKLGETAITTANQTVTITFTVPAGASLGNTVLRVRNVYFNTGEPTPVDACYSYGFGETEDYGIAIQNSGSSTACIPTSANGTADGDYINSVVLNTIDNTASGGTAAPTYTDFSSTFSTSLVRNGVYTVILEGGSYEADNYAVWIDYDQDDVFEAAEKLGEYATTAAGEVGGFLFTVPTNAALGNTAMRVRGVFFNTGEPTTVDPCYSYAYGETEDYGITILAAPSDYCTPSSLAGTGDGDFINGVELSTISNLNSGNVAGPSYTDYSGTESASLLRDSEYTLTIQAGTYAPDAYAAWIDYDQDDTFETGEKLGEFVTAAGGESNDIVFTVPDNATVGITRMRVRGVYVDENTPDPIDPCYPYNFGETEDYRIVIEFGTGIATNEQSSIQLYPNPASSLVTVELPSSGVAQIQLLDAQGRLIQAQQNSGQRALLDVSDVAAGTYMVRITQDGRTFSQRLEVLGN
ncbi:MAG: zinc-dependent metalloprotease [Flavobacteriales bacterium]|nr:zinc-dependent metalloprotease [Flavobacteriales bacterium]